MKLQAVVLMSEEKAKQLNINLLLKLFHMQMHLKEPEWFTKEMIKR